MSFKRLAGLAIGLTAVVGWSASSLAADVAAGKAKFEGACGDCHEAADFEGETVASLADSIRKIVSKQTKHKEALTLSEPEIDNVAAYMATGGK